MFELWIKNDDGEFKRFKSSNILADIQYLESYHNSLGFIAEIRINP